MTALSIESFQLIDKDTLSVILDKHHILHNSTFMHFAGFEKYLRMV